MSTQTAEKTVETTTVDALQRTLRVMSALSEKSIKKLASYIEELIEDEEEAEDIVYIEAHRDDPIEPFNLKDYD